MLPPRVRGNGWCVWRYVAVALGILMLGAVAIGCALTSSEPIARFSCAAGTYYPYQGITFDGAASSAGRSTIEAFEWDFGDGALGTGVVSTHAYHAAGNYTVSLSIRTADGLEASATRVIEVEDALVVPSVCSTIQGAIDQAKDGDTVVVLPGTYYVQLALRGKDVTLKSTNPKDPAVVRATILRPLVVAVVDGISIPGGRPIVTIGEGSHATLAGFTITGSVACAECASGAILIRDSSPLIHSNRIIGNKEGGIVSIESAAQIVENEFSDNVCSPRGLSGAAIHLYGCNLAPVIEGNTFSRNSAQSGGAIYVGSACADLTAGGARAGILKRNTFSGNAATRYSGGAVFVEYGARVSLDTPDSNTYQGNTPDSIFYVVPPS